MSLDTIAALRALSSALFNEAQSAFITMKEQHDLQNEGGAKALGSNALLLDSLGKACANAAGKIDADERAAARDDRA